MERALSNFENLPRELREIFEAELAARDEVIQKKDSVIDSLSTQLKLLQQQMDLMIKRMYGRKSEKLDPNQALMDELMLQAEGTTAPVVEPPAAVEPEVKPKKKSKRNGRMPIPEHLKRNIIDLDVPESEKICPVTGKERPLIGYEETEKYHYVKESLEVNVYRRAKYGSPMGAEENGVVVADLPECMIPRCLADASMLAHVAVAKFDDHLPLYRIEKQFMRQGVNISRKTQTDWLRRLAEGLKPLEQRIKERILATGVVHHDDTPVKQLDPGMGKTTETRLWVAVSGQGPPLVHFSFSPNRKQQHVLSFFRGYSGAVMCDEYAGYDNMDSGVKQSCWAHVRRKFHEAKASEPVFAEEVLLAIAELYKIEKRIAGLSPEERSKARDEEARKASKAVFDLLENRASLPASRIGKAVNYALGHRKGLTAYLDDERLPIDNNPAERAIRRVAIGRKNWLFLGSETGGDTAATLMTLLGSCWANKVNAQDYLEDVIAQLPGIPAEDLDTLLPDQWIDSHPDAVLPDQNWKKPRENVMA
jgi:transposase